MSEYVCPYCKRLLSFPLKNCPWILEGGLRDYCNHETMRLDDGLNMRCKIEDCPLLKGVEYK
jgi:hypothetical protein